MVWTKSESELRQFMNEINQKHQSIKFNFKFSKESIDSVHQQQEQTPDHSLQKTN